MEVELRKVVDVKPYPGNPRLNEDGVEAVANSIREFGFRQPIVVDDDGTIVVGHTRYLAALKLKLESVPVHVAEGLTPEQSKAYRLEDNKSSEHTEWDWKKLKVELKSLVGAGFDLGNLSFKPHELEPLLDEDWTPQEDDVSDGSLLDKLSVFLGEPETQVENGEAYNISPWHVLVVADVITEVEVWKPHLADGMHFAPYPGPLAAATIAALEWPHLFVQPDSYIAGHFLDTIKRLDGEVVKQ